MMNIPVIIVSVILFYWNHNSSFLENWRLNVDYTKVSDKRYFTDFDSDYGDSTDGYANQYARIAYYKPNYNFAISARQFQILMKSISGLTERCHKSTSIITKMIWRMVGSILNYFRKQYALIMIVL